MRFSSNLKTRVSTTQNLAQVQLLRRGTTVIILKPIIFRNNDQGLKGDQNPHQIDGFVIHNTHMNDVLGNQQVLGNQGTETNLEKDQLVSLKDPKALISTSSKFSISNSCDQSISLNHLCENDPDGPN